MSEFYNIYSKDKWRSPEYKVMDKFSLKVKRDSLSAVQVVSGVILLLHGQKQELMLL